MQTAKMPDLDRTPVIRDFPQHIYQPSGGWRAFLLIISLLLGGFSAAGVWYFGTMHEVRSAHAAIWMVGICLVFVFLSGVLIALLFRSRVILRPDSVESRELFSTGKLFREDILGRRLQQNPRGPASLVLVPRDSSRKPLKFATFYNFDATFWDWIVSLRDLDREDQRAVEREILENPEIGATPEDRLAALTTAKRLATFLTVVACAIGAWGWFYPEPYRLVIASMIVLPWLAVVITMRSGGLFRIDAKRGDPHPTVAVAFIVPGCVLALRAMNDVNLTEWRTALYFSLLLAFALAITTVIADRSLRSQKLTMFVLILFAIAYAYGAILEINTIFDRSGSTIFSTQVVKKEIVSGKSADYQLYLAPWGPQRETNEVSVSRQWYETIQPGDTICPALHQGALHIRWYTVHPCEQP